MGLSLKPEVRFADPLQAIPTILLVATLEFAHHGQECVVTSLGDGKHGEESLHPKGLAVDLRSKHLPSGLKQTILQALRIALPQCDILLEYEGQPNEHYHLEWDPEHNRRVRA